MHALLRRNQDEAVFNWQGVQACVHWHLRAAALPQHSRGNDCAHACQATVWLASNDGQLSTSRDVGSCDWWHALPRAYSAADQEAAS
jgi:hypothetical protein